MGDKESQTDTLVFRRKKRVKDIPARLFAHAHTLVRKSNQDMPAFLPNIDSNGAFIDNRLHGVAGEIHQRKLYQIGVKQGNAIIGTVKFYIDGLAPDGNAHEIERLPDYGRKHTFS